MLIEKLKITGHPAIGTVDVDFCDETGEPARTVVIAGQNGVGKTVVLEAIHGLFSPDGNFQGLIEASVRLDDEEARHFSGQNQAFQAGRQTLHLQRAPRSTLSAVLPGQFGNNPFGISNVPHRLALRSFFSDANVLYPKNPVQRIEPNTLDREGLQAMRSGNAQGVEIPNLLAALRQADLEEKQVYEEENPGQPLLPGMGTRRLDRFRQAYGMMMPHKLFRSIRQQPGEYQVVFAGDGYETNIHDLSTGEKQIVFRAGFFIRDAGVMQKNVVLIDEPELSLSPDWQAKILGFYSVALSVDGLPHPQIICATHSPFIVHSASAGKVLVLQRTTDGRVEEMPEPVFPGISSSVAVRAFNLDRFVREVQPGAMTVLTEGETDHLILEAAWNKLHPGQPIPFQTRPGSGSGPLQSLLNSPALSTLTDIGKIVGLFDFDDAWNQWNGVWKKLTPLIVSADDTAGQVKKHPTLPAWTMLLPVPPFRSTMASSATTFKGRSLLSIEFMFRDAEIPPHMFSEEAQPGGGLLPIFRDRYKREFAESVGQIDGAHFAAFQPLFDRLSEIHRAP